MSEDLSILTSWETKLSSKATALANVVRLNDYRQSHSIRGDWQSRKVQELKSLAADCALDQTDFDEMSALRAQEFIEALPFDIELPAIGIEDSGRVLLEWFAKLEDDATSIFSVVFGRDNYIFSLMAPNGASCHGALNYGHVSTDFLITQIKHHFELSNTHARFAAR